MCFLSGRIPWYYDSVSLEVQLTSMAFRAWTLDGTSRAQCRQKHLLKRELREGSWAGSQRIQSPKGRLPEYRAKMAMTVFLRTRT